MVKISAGDALAILRRFGQAGEESYVREIDQLKVTHPQEHNTLAVFRFRKKHYYLLFDLAAEDDQHYIVDQIKTDKLDVKGELLKNPHADLTTYALPFKGKEVYLFAVISSKKRLDLALSEKYPDTSRSTWQKHIKAGHISVNGTVQTSPKHDTAEADAIAINTPGQSDFSSDTLPIIYIDDDVIVVNKPAGVLTHSKGALNDEFTVADFFRRYTTWGLDGNRPGIVHRLDRDTSGVIIGARHAEAAALLQKQFAERTAKKIYLAIMDGTPKHLGAAINLPIGRNPNSPSTFRVDPKGKTATTDYTVLDATTRYSLVKLEPHTGRTHQLRVHANYLGTPIHGDRVYGTAADRLYLHAWQLEVTLPHGVRQHFTAPIPDAFVARFPNMPL